MQRISTKTGGIYLLVSFMLFLLLFVVLSLLYLSFFFILHFTDGTSS